jgi:hypothetical protein
VYLLQGRDSFPCPVFFGSSAFLAGIHRNAERETFKLYAQFQKLWPLQRLGAAELRASVLDCGSLLPLFHRELMTPTVAEDCRSPKPRGNFWSAFSEPGHSA